MSLQLLLNESYLTVSYDHQHDWLYANWRGDQHLATVQPGCHELLRLLAQQRCHKVLNDNQLVTSMWSEAAEWAGRDWFPAMLAAGLHAFAWVYSPNLYSRLSTDLTLQFAPGNALVATFDDAATARAWLAQV